jgi:triosephosphate isomerase
MGRKKIVAGNWKMNLTYQEASNLVKEVMKTEGNSPGVTRIFFPPFPFLRSVAQKTEGKKNFFVGAQNCNDHASGAYTGEVSASMIKSIGCKYVLIGHSERRIFFNETDEQLRAKMEQAIQNGLIPVFCFGEQLVERKADKHFETVEKQLKTLKTFNKKDVREFILAYEPVWAIGTGETASPHQAQAMHAYVRSCLQRFFDAQLASEVSIIYGGSCNASNARELFICPDVDGGLIGGASLKADEFSKIIQSF